MVGITKNKNYRVTFNFDVVGEYTKMPDFYPTKRATKGYVTGWGKRLNDSPALWSRYRYDTYYESWVRSR